MAPSLSCTPQPTPPDDPPTVPDKPNSQFRTPIGRNGRSQPLGSPDCPVEDTCTLEIEAHVPLARLSSTLSHLTIDEAIEQIGFGRFHWQLVLLCGVGYFAEITELVVVSFVAPSIQKQMNLSDVQYGLLGSSSFVGMAAGALFWGYVSDNFGRKLSFSMTVWLTFLGGFLSAFSSSYTTLILLRFTAAFGIGGMLPVDYTVFLEFLPQEKRGSHIVLVDAIGVVPALALSALISWYFSGSEQVEWRWVLLVASIPVGIMGVLRQHVPESPRYHLAAGDAESAKKVIQAVADMNKAKLPDEWKLVRSRSSLSTLSPHKYELPPHQTDPDANCRQNAYHESSRHDDAEIVIENGHNFADLLRSDLRPTTWRLWLLYFLIQFGSAGMVFALPKLFEESFVGQTERNIALDLLIGVVGLIPGLTIAYFVVEISRRLSLAAFAVTASLSVLALGRSFTSSSDRVVAIMASIFLRGAMEGCFAILNTTAVESYPTVLRARGLGTAQIFDHIAGSIAPLCFSSLNGVDALRSWTFIIFATAYMLVTVPSLTLPNDYAGAAVNDY